MNEVSLDDEPAAGYSNNDAPLLDVDVGRLLGRVHVPVKAKAEANTTPHCVGWVVLDSALVIRTGCPLKFLWSFETLFDIYLYSYVIYYRVFHDTGHPKIRLSPRPFINMNWTPENLPSV